MEEEDSKEMHAQNPSIEILGICLSAHLIAFKALLLLPYSWCTGCVLQIDFMRLNDSIRVLRSGGVLLFILLTAFVLFQGQTEQVVLDSLS